MVTKNLVACIRNARLLSFFALYDSPGNKFPRRFCAVFVSDWLGSLVHIHFKPFVDERRRVVRLRVSFIPEGRRYLKLEGPDT